MQSSPNFSIIADYGDLCGEGPLWHPEQATLYWTDLAGHHFYAYDWREKRSRILNSSFEICGFAFNKFGGFVVGNSDGFWVWDGQDRRTHLASQLDGFACRINDCVADPAGRLLAGSCFYDAEVGTYSHGHLMCLELDGAVRVLDDGIHLANGLGFSPDGCTLYFADSAERVIYAYDYDATEGRAYHRRPFVQVPL